MIDYKLKTFTYRPLVIGEHPELAEAPYNLVPGMLDPASVAVLTVELDRIETILPSMAEFEARFEPVDVDSASSVGPTATREDRT